MKQRPDDFKVLLERFRFHAEREETAEAAAAYGEASIVRGDEQLFRIRLGDACASLRQWSKARDEYVLTLDLGLLGDGELTRTTWLRAAMLQLYLGDVDGYRQTCSRLFERYASNEDWRTRMALTRISLLHAEPGIAPERIASLTVPTKSSSDDSRGLHAAAVISLRMGKDDVEPQALEAAWNRAHFDSQRIALARVLHARGDYAKARTTMNLIPSENRLVDPNSGTAANWDNNLEIRAGGSSDPIREVAGGRRVDEEAAVGGRHRCLGTPSGSPGQISSGLGCSGDVPLRTGSVE